MGTAVGLGIVFIGRQGWALATWALVLAGIVVLGFGVALGRGGETARRRAWELQAIGAAIAATGWVSGSAPGS